jgi:hypothetical protein
MCASTRTRTPSPRAPRRMTVCIAKTSDRGKAALSVGDQWLAPFCEPGPTAMVSPATRDEGLFNQIGKFLS